MVQLRGRRKRGLREGLDSDGRERNPPRWVSWDPKGRRTLALSSANLLGDHACWVETLQADEALLQETRAPAEGLAAARAQAKDAGRAGEWEAAVPDDQGGPASWSERAVGSPGCPLLDGTPGGKPLRVVTIYGYD